MCVGTRVGVSVCVCVGWASRGSLVRFSPLEIPRGSCSVWFLFFSTYPCLSAVVVFSCLWGFVIDTNLKVQ